MPPRNAIPRYFLDRLLQRDHAVCNAAHLQVNTGSGPVVQHHHRAGTAGKKLLERQHLAPVTQRRIGQQLQLRQGINHHACGLAFLDGGKDQLHGGAHFHLRGVEHGVLGLRLQQVL
jgi:hypothetical protein